MKKTTLSMFAVLALASAGAAMAAEPQKAASPYSYELGLTTHHETYKEREPDGAPVMKEVGALAGIQGSVSRAVSDTGRLKLSGEYAIGNSDYTGSYMGGNYGSLREYNLSRYSFQTSLVYSHSEPSWNGIELKGGLGYRRLVDNLQEAGPGGYKRINNRYFAIVGVERSFDTQHWTITPSVEYNYSVRSRQESVDSTGNLPMEQDRGDGFVLSAAFAFKDAAFPVTFRPFVRTWDIEDSRVNSGFYEPRNRTLEFGASVGYRF